MKPEPIDLTRLTVRTLRWLDDGRRAFARQWDRLTAPDQPRAEPPSDRRQPPDIW